MNLAPQNQSVISRQSRATRKASLILDVPEVKKKEAFHRYLEQSGVLDGMTKAVQKLYDSEPQAVNPLEFLKSSIGVQSKPPPVSETMPTLPSNGTCEKELYGEYDGGPVYMYTLKAPNGTFVRCIPWGATVVSINVPNRDGTHHDVCLGYDHFENYLSVKNPCMGAIPGRVANRISNATFQLEGKTYNLNKNDGENCLHGGPQGFHKKLWNATPGSGASIMFSCVSHDKEEGFP
ncbi:hypothetical protein CYMTET_36312, partial [Cymbomonas tetramitiformis]